jgi:hypothetical protein
MARGKKSRVGDIRVAPNGYQYTRTEAGWALTHRLLVERDLGRSLRYDERVRFRDGNRANLNLGNLEVRKVKESTKERKRARIEARIEELQAQLEELDSSTELA